MTTTPNRGLRRAGIEVSPMGLGCWAIGGPWTLTGTPAGWTDVDDAESIRAIHAALDLGVNFFDTAANYGAGRSERVLGRAVKDPRGEHKIERALEAREVLEKLVGEGKIRTYGWSTDRTDAIRAFSASPRCGVIEQQRSGVGG